MYVYIQSYRRLVNVTKFICICNGELYLNL
jgi:hypothetical protein